MKDYDCLFDDGSSLPISQLSNELIAESLADGVESFDPNVPADAILERLRLEVFIRENNLREDH